MQKKKRESALESGNRSNQDWVEHGGLIISAGLIEVPNGGAIWQKPSE